MRSKIIIVVLLLIIAVSFQPQPAVEVQYIQLPPQFVDRVVTITVYKPAKVVEVIKNIVEYVKVPDYELRHFRNKAQLLEWLELNWVEDMGEQKCVAEALELQRRAFRDGYQMSTESLFDGRKEPKYEYWPMANSVVIGNDIFFIESAKKYVWQGGRVASG